MNCTSLGARSRSAAHDELLVHVDIDVLSWVDFPIAENSRRRDGLLLTELREVLVEVLTDVLRPPQAMSE